MNVIKYVVLLCSVLSLTAFNALAYDAEAALALPNSYMVLPGNSVTFPITKLYAVWENVEELKALNEDLTGSLSAELLWQDEKELISSITLSGTDENAVIKVETNTQQICGNALVAVKIGGVTRWSWHIWVTDYNPEQDNVAYNYQGEDVLCMNRNLGATSGDVDDVASYGLLYQFGRKEPYKAFCESVLTSNYLEDSCLLYDINNNVLSSGVVCKTVSESENLKNTIENPLSFYLGFDGNENDWYSSVDLHNDSLWLGKAGAKGLFDPSPEGWRVPTEGLMQLCFSDTMNQKTLPLAGSRDYSNGTFFMSGYYGMYWTCSSNGAFADYIFRSQLLTDVESTHYRANAYAVRCVKCSDNVSSVEPIKNTLEGITIWGEDKSIYVKGGDDILGNVASVYAVNGVCVNKIVISSKRELIADNLMSGIYLVKMKEGKGVVKVIIK